MTSVARAVVPGAYALKVPGAVDGGRAASSCPARFNASIWCQTRCSPTPLGEKPGVLLAGRGGPLSSFLGGGALWHRAVASCRCTTARVQMSETNLYKGLSSRAIKTFGMAELEARKLKYATTGTEVLLMGLLTEGTSKGARFLRSKGITLYAVKQETVKLLGKGDMYYNPPEHPPVTEPGKKALEAAHAYRDSLSGGQGEVTTEHLLLGLLDQKAATAAQVLRTLGIEDAAYEELKQLAKGQATTVA